MEGKKSGAWSLISQLRSTQTDRIPWGHDEVRRSPRIEQVSTTADHALPATGLEALDGLWRALRPGLLSGDDGKPDGDVAGHALQ